MENPYHKWRFRSLGKLSISMGHPYHGYVSHNQRVKFHGSSHQPDPSKKTPSLLPTSPSPRTHWDHSQSWGVNLSSSSGIPSYPIIENLASPMDPVNLFWNDVSWLVGMMKFPIYGNKMFQTTNQFLYIILQSLLFWFATGTVSLMK